jgi:hypothetical protein
MSRLLLRPAAFWGVLFLTIAVRAQLALPGMDYARSASGQFTISGTQEYSPLFHRPELATNVDWVRLEPALLAVSAERFKAALWNQLGLKSDAAWRGKIFLILRPARSTADGITIISTALLQNWNYRVELPDGLTRIRCSRALAAALLLEIANRDSATTGRSAEIPAWLTDGLAQQTLAAGGVKIILSAPPKKLNLPPQSRIDESERGLDLLAAARRALQNSAALTFEQLSWPHNAQLDGNDGGVYRASAQLFVNELLHLKNGPEKMRALLTQLPDCLNWQTAFFSAFREDFPRPLDLEKWWALRVIAFAAHDPGPRWTLAASRERLAALLSVPVEYRVSSNALPEHAEIPLQAAFRNFTADQLTAVLPAKLRDLNLAQLRLAPPFALLANSYRTVLANYLGEGQRSPANTVGGKHPTVMRRRAGLEDTLKQLDALDFRRRETEARLDAAVQPLNLNRATP